MNRSARIAASRATVSLLLVILQWLGPFLHAHAGLASAQPAGGGLHVHLLDMRGSVGHDGVAFDRLRPVDGPVVGLTVQYLREKALVPSSPAEPGTTGPADAQDVAAGGPWRACATDGCRSAPCGADGARIRQNAFALRPPSQAPPGMSQHLA